MHQVFCTVNMNITATTAENRAILVHSGSHSFLGCVGLHGGLERGVELERGRGRVGEGLRRAWREVGKGWRRAWSSTHSPFEKPIINVP